jgi:hypothetical protein
MWEDHLAPPKLPLVSTIMMHINSSPGFYNSYFAILALLGEASSIYSQEYYARLLVFCFLVSLSKELEINGCKWGLHILHQKDMVSHIKAGSPGVPK